MLPYSVGNLVKIENLAQNANIERATVETEAQYRDCCLKSGTIKLCPQDAINRKLQTVRLSKIKQ